MFVGTGYAALQAMDSVPNAEAVRAERAARNAVLERKAQKAKKAARIRKARKTTRRSASRGRQWAIEADAACDRTYNEGWELIDESAIENPKDFVLFLEESLGLGDRLIVALERLGPAPNRQGYARLLQTLRASQAADRRAIASLRASWDPLVFREALLSSTRVNERMRKLSLRLGSVGCAQLFDPAQL